jgi:uncharacterized protein YabE (DUF348 family)
MPDGRTFEHSGIDESLSPRDIIIGLSLTLYPEDRVSAFPDPELGIGSTIRLERAPVIKLRDGKKDLILRSWATTAGELLAEKNIELGADDKANFRSDSRIFDGSELTIIRVAVTTVVETEKIDFKIIQRDDPNLSYGKRRIELGEKGERRLTYQVRREDGEEVSRILLLSEIIKEPKSQINYTGTKVTVLSSVSGRATMTPVSTYVVSPNYPRGTVIRITNRINGKRIIATVNATWGTASPPSGVVLDLAPKFLSELGCSSYGCSSVLVEEIK